MRRRERTAPLAPSREPPPVVARVLPRKQRENEEIQKIKTAAKCDLVTPLAQMFQKIK